MCVCACTARMSHTTRYAVPHSAPCWILTKTLMDKGKWLVSRREKIPFMWRPMGTWMTRQMIWNLVRSLCPSFVAPHSWLSLLWNGGSADYVCCRCAMWWAVQFGSGPRTPGRKFVERCIVSFCDRKLACPCPFLFLMWMWVACLLSWIDAEICCPKEAGQVEGLYLRLLCALGGFLAADVST